MIAPIVVMAADAAPVLQQMPNDYDRAVEARRNARPNDALRILDRLRRTRPSDADVALERGLTLLQLGRIAEAEAEFVRTLRLAPTYDDARLGLARIAYGQGDYEKAAAGVEPLAASGNPEATELLSRVRAAMAAAPLDWQVNVSTTYSSFEGDRQDWVDTIIAARGRISPSAHLMGSIQPSRRFGRTEVYSEIGGELELADNASIHAAAGFTPDAQFLPSWRVTAGARVKVRDGRNATVLLLDVTQAHYAVGDVQTLAPGIEQYLGNGKTWLTGRWINVVDELGEMRTGWSLRGDTMLSDKFRIFAGYADVPDSSAGRTIDTHNVYGGAAYDLGNRYALTFTLGHEQRSIGADRTMGSLGLTMRF